MKIRWREHEGILVTLISLIGIAGNLWRVLSLSTEDIQRLYATAYIEQNLAFDLYLNIILPQVAQVLVLYTSYWVIMLLIVPKFAQQIPWNDSGSFALRKTAWIIALVLFVTFALALLVNVISYYANPSFFNYGGAGFSILALFGYNDQPLANVFSGVGRSFIIVAMITAFGFVRELVILHLENSRRSTYRIYISNQVTFILVIYVSILGILSAINANVHGQNPFFYIYLSFIPSSILVFLANLYWIFPSARQPVLNLRTITRIVLSTFFFVLPFAYVIRYHIPFEHYFLWSWCIEMVIITPISYLVYQFKKDRINQLRGVQEQLTRSKADLQFLRSQINPHFLFNTLNTLYGTALLEKSPRTAEGIQMLGDMMRFMLHPRNPDFIPMHAEIEYLKNYISLQKLRTNMSPDVSIESNLNECNCEHNIAPMLLIPLVENAFKHGINLSGKSRIQIKLECDEKEILFEVRNSVHQVEYTDPECEKSGIGLENVRERLQLIYKSNYHFECRTVGNEFVVQLSLRPE